jgi:hypothetical protein
MFVLQASGGSGGGAIHIVATNKIIVNGEVFIVLLVRVLMS